MSGVICNISVDTTFYFSLFVNICSLANFQLKLCLLSYIVVLCPMPQPHQVNFLYVKIFWFWTLLSGVRMSTLLHLCHWLGDPHQCCCFPVPLDFAGELYGTSDVSAVQVELWVEVFLGCDRGGVVRTGTLWHVALRETRRDGKWCCFSEEAAGGGRRCGRWFADVLHRYCGDSYPIVSCVLFSNPQEGLQRSLWAWVGTMQRDHHQFALFLLQLFSLWKARDTKHTRVCFMRQTQYNTLTKGIVLQ